jgi:hypothetical protein
MHGRYGGTAWDAPEWCQRPSRGSIPLVEPRALMSGHTEVTREKEMRHGVKLKASAFALCGGFVMVLPSAREANRREPSRRTVGTPQHGGAAPRMTHTERARHTGGPWNQESSDPVPAMSARVRRWSGGMSRCSRRAPAPSEWRAAKQSTRPWTERWTDERSKRPRCDGIERRAMLSPL